MCLEGSGGSELDHMSFFAHVKEMSRTPRMLACMRTPVHLMVDAAPRMPFLVHPHLGLPASKFQYVGTLVKFAFPAASVRCVAAEFGNTVTCALHENSSLSAEWHIYTAFTTSII